VSSKPVVAAPASDEPQIVDGVSIPRRITTVRDVSAILNQPAMEGLNAAAPLNQHSAALGSREAKLEKLQAELKETTKRVARGDPELSHDERRSILSLRREAEVEYLAAQGSGQSVEAVAFSRRVAVTDALPTRTARSIDQTRAPPASLTFIPNAAAEWSRRGYLLSKFIAAARLVCLLFCVPPFHSSSRSFFAIALADDSWV
jgi:hypothetical protein